MIITQLVRIIPEMSITLERDTTDIMGGCGNKIISYTTDISMYTNLNFEAIKDPHKNNCLCTIIKKVDKNEE